MKFGPLDERFFDAKIENQNFFPDYLHKDSLNTNGIRNLLRK